MGLDGLDGDVELFGDFFVGVAAGDEAHDFAFAFGEAVEVLIDGEVEGRWCTETREAGAVADLETEGRRSLGQVVTAGNFSLDLDELHAWM